MTSPGVRGRMRRFAPLLGLAGLALILGGCQVPTFGAFRGATVQGKDEFKLWFGMVVAGFVVAGLVWLLIFWTIFRYRRRNDSIPRQFHESIPLEIIYTVVPIIIVAVIFYFTVLTENEVTAVSAKPAAIVDVLGYQWGWRFTYHSGSDKPLGVVIETSQNTKYKPTVLPQNYDSPQYPELVLPEGETTRIDLQSNDVIHGFYIPAFNFSRYATPGFDDNYFDLTPTATGFFKAQCTQYCGLYHAEMIFRVRVVTPAQFSRWLVAQHATGVAA